jgi:hypothetical protein
MGRAGDTAALLEAWERAESDAIRAAVLEEISHNSRDAAGRDLVIREAGSASTEPVKLAAVRALGAYQESQATLALIRALGDPWPAVREVAEVSLAPRSKDFEGELRFAMSSDASHLVRAGCARMLPGAVAANPALRGEIEDALLDRAVRDDAPKVREAAVVALGLLNVTRARSQLVELMRTDPDAGVRMSAERAIQKLGEGAMSRAVVAVLPLNNNTGLDDPDLRRLCRHIAEYVAARLSQGKVCEVVDREKLEKAIEEMKKIGAAIYDGDAPNAPEIGRFKIANQLVYGSLGRQGLVYTIVLNRMDIATLSLVPGAAVTVQGYRADLEQLKVRAADQLLSSFR